MSRKSIAYLFILIISPVVVYLLWPSDEARIRKLIKEGAASVEREDLEAVMSKVSFGYRDEYGLNYMLLKGMLKRHFDTYAEMKVEYENLTVKVVDVEPKTAAANLDLRVIASEGGQRGYVFGDLKEPLRLRLDFEKGPTGKWLVSGGYAGEMR